MICALKKAGLLFALTALSSAAFAQDISTDSLLKQKYNEQTIYLTGTGSYIKDNQKYPLGFIFSNLKAEMQDTPAALQVLNTGRRNIVAGGILSTVGSLIISMTLLYWNVGEIQQTPALAATGAGLGAMGVGAYLNFKGLKQLNRSVWMHNREALLK